jgi:hypothetical protein
MFSRKKKKFRILIEGKNLLIDVRGVEKLGYFTTRYVEAFDVDEACECALDLVRNELNSTGALLNDINDLPLAVISGVAQIASFRGIDVPGRGFSFFSEDESE